MHQIQRTARLVLSPELLRQIRLFNRPVPNLSAGSKMARRIRLQQKEEQQRMLSLLHKYSF
jgi:hypothetical protein